MISKNNIMMMSSSRVYIDNNFTITVLIVTSVIFDRWFDCWILQLPYDHPTAVSLQLLFQE